MQGTSPSPHTSTPNPSASSALCGRLPAVRPNVYPWPAQPRVNQPLAGKPDPNQPRFGAPAAHSAHPAHSAHLLPRPFSLNIGSRFGERVRELRLARNMTQSRMAVRFGIDRTFISDLERGKKSITLPTLEILALGFKVSLSELFRDL